MSKQQHLLNYYKPLFVRIIFIIRNFQIWNVGGQVITTIHYGYSQFLLKLIITSQLCIQLQVSLFCVMHSQQLHGMQPAGYKRKYNCIKILALYLHSYTLISQLDCLKLFTFQLVSSQITAREIHRDWIYSPNPPDKQI